MKQLFIIICIAFVSITSYAQNSMQLLFIGDVMGHDGQIASAYNEETKKYEFDSCYVYISDILKAHDFAIANLEVTLNCAPYTGYPAFSSPSSLAGALVHNGVNCYVTANNHTADRGKRGVTKTIKALDSIGVMHTGTFASQKERDKKYPLILEKHGIKIALLNYTYGLNGNPIPEGTIINIIDSIQIKKDIQRAKSVGVDKIIVFVHWGLEYELEPNTEQIKLANYMKQVGADIIIGSHPHVVQRSEFNKTEQQFVVYSLGNFISNQRTQPRDGGNMIHIELQKNNDTVSITQAGYILTWVYTPTINNKKKFYVLPVSEYENKPEFFDNAHSFETMQSCVKTMRSVLRENINTPEIIYTPSK